MKAITFLMVVAALVFAMPGCKKSSNNGTPAAADSSFMKATINGTTPFSFTGALLASASSMNSGGIVVLYITGGELSSGKAIQLRLENPSATGTVPLATGDGSADYHASGGMYGSYSYADSGSVTIATWGQYIRGTFSFHTADGTNITAGSFAVKAP